MNFGRLSTNVDLDLPPASCNTGQLALLGENPAKFSLRKQSEKLLGHLAMAASWAFCPGEIPCSASTAFRSA